MESSIDNASRRGRFRGRTEALIVAAQDGSGSYQDLPGKSSERVGLCLRVLPVECPGNSGSYTFKLPTTRAVSLQGETQ